jgi:hypothetical protein
MIPQGNSGTLEEFTIVFLTSKTLSAACLRRPSKSEACCVIVLLRLRLLIANFFTAFPYADRGNE